MKKISIFLSLTVLFLLTGCATGPTSYSSQPKLGFMYSSMVQMYYSGATRPLEEVAVISYDATLTPIVKNQNGEIIKPEQIFGKRGLYSTGMNQSHLMPGNYVFSFSYFYSDKYTTVRSTTDFDLAVELKKGEIAHFSALMGGRSWSVVKRDGSNELAKIRDDYQQAINTRIK
jgi:uncharacterized protein YceK